jgi:hypothetical protein
LLGWPLIVGLGLTLCVGGFYIYIEKSVQPEILHAEQSATALRKLVATRPALVSSTTSPVQQLEEFYQSLPHQSALQELLGKLYAAAAAQNLTLAQGDYRFVEDPATKLTRYEITLPTKGSYIQIRKFLAQALIDLPTVALNGMTFNRQKIEDPLLDVQLQLTLYLGAE